MFYNFKNVQTAQQKCLRQPIDNRDGNLRIGLRSITYTVGWYSVVSDEEIPGIAVSPGLYGYKRLKKLVESREGITLTVNKENGLATLTVAENRNILLTHGLRTLLGFHEME